MMPVCQGRVRSYWIGPIGLEGNLSGLVAVTNRKQPGY